MSTGNTNMENALQAQPSRTQTNSIMRVTKLIYREVVRWGSLWRPGRIFSTNFKEVHAIITKFGFFHYFASKESLKPEVSIQLAEVRIKDVSGDAFSFENTRSEHELLLVNWKPNRPQVQKQILSKKRKNGWRDWNGGRYGNVNIL
eukprot:TRINITY_DN3613_c0_g1_i1.p1 TRINITY_DN3613_c0_g1~~TRINITY_DN3613_c0_g1_i1.p1  ORF type:complete len:146 (+),score=23.87 TRINITY_DN3613_c0_g1_i1:86-523(+)